MISKTLEQNARDNILIGICSGSEDPADKRNASESGAHFFVNKPLDLRSLGDVCEACEVLKMRQSETGETTIVWAT